MPREIGSVLHPTYVLTPDEKLSIISSILSGIGNSARFDVDVIRERIKQSLEIAEEFLCPNQEYLVQNGQMD